MLLVTYGRFTYRQINGHTDRHIQGVKQIAIILMREGLDFMKYWRSTTLSVPRQGQFS